ncbi:MAG: N-acetyltransferase [Desulfovibrionaceae bacterium]
MGAHIIRKARVQDAKPIHALLMECSAQGLLLPRSFNAIYSHLRDFYVASPDAERTGVSGCCALSIAWADLAEIRSLVVGEALRGKGLGRKLVEACLSESVTLGIFKVFTLTYQPRFFEKVGFREVTKDMLPQKVWADCIHCPKFPECDETAMLLEM